MCRIYHCYGYTVLAFDLTYQVLDSDYMSIYQLLGQVHSIQLLLLKVWLHLFHFQKYVFLEFKICFFKHFHVSALIEHIECPQRRISGIVILRY